MSMKRRSFLGNLAALVLAPGAILRPSDSPEAPDIAPRPETVPAVKRGGKAYNPEVSARAFAAKFELEVLIHPQAGGTALFTVRHPAGVKRWTTALRFSNLAPVADHPVMLQRQLAFQYRKTLEFIELEHGWRRIPPHQEKPRGVASIIEGDYLPSPSSPTFVGWTWEKLPLEDILSSHVDDALRYMSAGDYKRSRKGKRIRGELS